METPVFRPPSPCSFSARCVASERASHRRLFASQLGGPCLASFVCLSSVCTFNQLKQPSHPLSIDSEVLSSSPAVSVVAASFLWPDITSSREEQTNIKGGSYVQVGVSTPWFFSLAISLANLLPSLGYQGFSCS
ncbi:hypothetical protein PIB30_021825 [Stylosanthes scabra]|uniref:Uncharacterized protein n=1 Tax=Stylosanthes scabra TaxID=79078 RepID=A0ABU6XAD4_9FABA|nr:hypothetical protein [Stylosanthes scabra]